MFVNDKICWISLCAQRECVWFNQNQLWQTGEFIIIDFNRLSCGVCLNVIGSGSAVAANGCGCECVYWMFNIQCLTAMNSN